MSEWGELLCFRGEISMEIYFSSMISIFYQSRNIGLNCEIIMVVLRGFCLTWTCRTAVTSNMVSLRWILPLPLHFDYNVRHNLVLRIFLNVWACPTRSNSHLVTTRHLISAPLHLLPTHPVMSVWVTPRFSTHFSLLEGQSIRFYEKRECLCRFRVGGNFTLFLCG